MGSLLTEDQGNFEGSGALGWVAVNATATRDTVAPLSGTKSLKWVSTVNGVAYANPSPDQIAIVPGARLYRANMRFKGPAGRAMQLWIRRWLPGLATYVDTVTPFTSTGAAQTVTGDLITLADTPAVSLYMIDLAATIGSAYWIDSVSFANAHGPLYRLYLGLDAEPLDALSSVAWTEVTDDLQAVTLDQGRNHERDQTKTGKLAVTVNSRSGDFNPENTSSPHYPKLKPGIRVRLTETFGGVTTNLFTGNLDGIQVNRLGPGEVEVEMEAYDAFEWMVLNNLQDPYEYAVLAAAPKAFYRFKETGSEASLPLGDASGGRQPATLYHPKQDVGVFTEGYEAGISHRFAPGRLVNFWDTASNESLNVESEFAGYGIAPTAGVTGTAWSYSFIFQRPGYRNAALYGSLLVQADAFANTDPGGNMWLFDGVYGDQLALTLQIYNAGVGILDLVCMLGHFDGANWVPQDLGVEALYQVIITRSGVNYEIHVQNLSHPGTGPFYVTGVATANPTFNSSQVWIATGQAHQFTAGVFYTFGGLFGELAIYPTALTGGERADIFGATTEWAEDLPGERMASGLEQLGWAAADQALEAGATALPEFTGGRALEHFQAAAKADDGLLFVDGSGIITFYGRHHLLTATRSVVSQANITDDGTGIPYLLNGLNPGMDKQDLYNRVVTQREGGAEHVASDPASIAALGKRELKETGLLANDENLMDDRATYKLAMYKDLKQRIRSVSFALHSDPLNTDGMITKILRAMLWDRLTYKQSLPGTSAFVQDSLVEGKSLRWSSQTNETLITLNLSPYPAQPSGSTFGQLNVSFLDIDAVAVY